MFKHDKLTYEKVIKGYPFIHVRVMGLFHRKVILQPTERPPAYSRTGPPAPPIIPGPPPVITVKPFSASVLCCLRASLYHLWSSLKRAEPNTLTHGPTKCRVRKPLMVSPKIRKVNFNSSQRERGPSR